MHMTIRIRRILPALLALAGLLLSLTVSTAQQPDKEAPRVDAELQKKINAAIDKGIAYLKQAKYAGNGDVERGLRALAAWALVESGVAAQDQVVKELTEQIRKESVRGDYNYTYTLGLTILLLDKLGEARDAPLMHSAGVRLLKGQNIWGGWSYQCPALSDAEQTRLAKYLEQTQGQNPATEPPPAPEIVEQLQTILGGKLSDKSYGDNSNTQFGIMGLWAARRHHMPVRRALNWVEERFLLSHFADGTWGYHPPNPDDQKNKKITDLRATRTSTCIGLYALATNAGLKNTAGKRLDLMSEPLIRSAFAALAPTLDKLEPTHPYERMCYYLFALEKTAEVFNQKTIGGKDWYRWGADWLVKTQRQDGSWSAPRGNEAGREDAVVAQVDTALALLFLKRVNPAHDLALNLQGLAKEPIRKTAAENLPQGTRDPHQLDLPTIIEVPGAKKGP
jgi:hypothetical protein